jgi:hypothetical protein
MMEVKFWLNTKNKRALLTAMIYSLAGNAHISFEGDLSKCDFSKIDGATTTETETLTRTTQWPKQDFIIVPIEIETAQEILDQILLLKPSLPEIIHIQIEKNGVIEFGAYDNFHPDCVACGFSIPKDQLERLVSQGAIHSFTLDDNVQKSQRE